MKNYPSRPRVPIIHMNHPTEIGIEILYDLEYKIIDFHDINPPVKRNGGKMAAAILKDFPQRWSPMVLMHWSEGSWSEMKAKYDRSKRIKDPFYEVRLL
jgi:hypothetical protein